MRIFNNVTAEWTFVNERECVYERDRLTKTDRQTDIGRVNDK